MQISHKCIRFRIVIIRLQQLALYLDEPSLCDCNIPKQTKFIIHENSIKYNKTLLLNCMTNLFTNEHISINLLQTKTQHIQYVLCFKITIFLDLTPYSTKYPQYLTHCIAQLFHFFGDTILRINIGISCH